MFERYSDRSRKVMVLANQEAKRFRHDYINPEHILLGLVKEGTGVGANLLINLKIDLNQLLAEIERLVKQGVDDVSADRLRMLPRAKKVIEYAILEARKLNHNYVGTEHLLLGILREGANWGAQALVNLGLTYEKVEQATVNFFKKID